MTRASAAIADHPLRRVRRKRGLTLVVLADLSGLSVPFLSMVENGQRSLSRRDHINALAAALRVAPAEIAPSTIPGFDEWAQVPRGHVTASPSQGAAALMNMQDWRSPRGWPTTARRRTRTLVVKLRLLVALSTGR